MRYFNFTLLAHSHNYCSLSFVVVTRVWTVEISTPTPFKGNTEQRTCVIISVSDPEFNFRSTMPADITSSVLQGIEDCHNKIIVTEKNVTTGQNFDVIDESAEETVGSKRKHSESNNDELNSKTTENIKHLKRPLANILPSKYKNVDCSTLFPDFQVGQVIINLNFIYFTITDINDFVLNLVYFYYIGVKIFKVV